MQSTQLLATILSRDGSYKSKVSEMQIKTIADYATPEEMEELITSGSLNICQAHKLYCNGAHLEINKILDCKKPCEPEELTELLVIANGLLDIIARHSNCWNLVDHITKLSAYDGAGFAGKLLRIIDLYSEALRKPIIDAALDIVFDHDSGQVQVAHQILYMQPGTRRPLLEACNREQTYKFLRNISIVGCFDAEDLKVAAKKLQITPA